MANTINVNQNNNNVSLQDNNGKITVTDNKLGTTIEVTQPVTNVVTVASLGPQGIPGKTQDTGSLLLTSSFNAFTASYYVASASFDINILNNSSSIALLSGSFETFSGSYNTGSFTGSFYGDGSNLTGIISSKWTGSNPITREGNVEITGSLIVSGSSTFINIGPAIFSGSVTSVSGFTGSLLGTSTSASYAATASYALNAGTNIDTGSFVTTSSFNDFTSSYDNTTGSFVTTSSFNDFTSSYNTGSFLGNLDGTASYANNSISTSYIQGADVDGAVFESMYATSAATASSITTLNQDVLITGSLTILQGATIYGSSSFQYVTASQLEVSASYISVNVFEPAQRFGGLYVYDSGSSAATASLSWDSLNNRWIYTNASGSSYEGGMLLSGPRNTGSIGNEPSLTRWFIARSDGGDHLNDTQIYSSASIHVVTGSLTVTEGITGSLLGTSSWANNAQTASYVTLAQTASYVLNAQTASYVLNAVSASYATTASYITLAQTASYVLQAISASYAPSTPSFPYTGSAEITGSLTVTGSIYTTSTIYSPFVIGLNFQTTTSYTFNAPYTFKINSVESNPSGSITIKYQSSGSAVTSSYVYGSTINKFDSLIITPPSTSLVILNSIKLWVISI